MSRKIVLTRKRSDEKEVSNKRNRLEEDVAMILLNISNEVPFHQERLDETNMNKKVFLSETLSHFFRKNVDHVFIYDQVFKYFIDYIIHEKLIFLDKNDVRKVFIVPIIEELIEKSSFKDYFKSKILDSLDTPTMEFKDVVALFRTHVYDKTISGIKNQEPSIYDEPCKISRELSKFLSIPKDTKIRRIEVYNKMCEYIDSKSLIQEKNNKKVIMLDASLQELFILKDTMIGYYMLYYFIRPHIIYENTEHKITTQLDPYPYIFEEFYINSENKLHGPVRMYHPNGKLKIESYFMNGIQSGTQKTFYENGMIRSIKDYINNQYDGICMLFNKDGNTVVFIEFKNNIPIKVNIGF
jgi:antitoxin component YwqK of YwqJK toxin-antitoxin module